MYVEKYKLVTIKYKEEKLSNIIKNDNYNNYNYNNNNTLNINFNLELIREWKHEFELIDDYIFDTKKDALKTLESIRYNYTNVQHWSILPVLVDVPITEARKLKINNVKENIN